MKLGTIKGRHELPVQKYLIEDEVSFNDAYQIAFKKMTEIVRFKTSDVVELYITGLTRVTLACVNAFLSVKDDHANIKELRILEYNTKTQEYETTCSYFRTTGEAVIVSPIVPEF